MNKNPVFTCPEKIEMIIFWCKNKIPEAIFVNVITAKEDDTGP
jgi:hypothetical protein